MTDESTRRPLSARELEVVRHLANGLTYAQTARAMLLSLGTVKGHIVNAYAAVGARNTAHLCVLVERSGQLA